MTTDEVAARMWAEYEGRIIAQIIPADSGWWVDWADTSDGLLFTLATDFAAEHVKMPGRQ